MYKMAWLFKNSPAFCTGLLHNCLGLVQGTYFLLGLFEKFLLIFQRYFGNTPGIRMGTDETQRVGPVKGFLSAAGERDSANQYTGLVSAVAVR